VGRVDDLDRLDPRRASADLVGVERERPDAAARGADVDGAGELHASSMSGWNGDRGRPMFRQIGLMRAA
jgi:hypothetical protein